MLSWRTNVSPNDKDTNPVTSTTYYHQYDGDTDTELMFSWRTNVSPTDRDTDPVTSTTYYQQH